MLLTVSVVWCLLLTSIAAGAMFAGSAEKEPCDENKNMGCRVHENSHTSSVGQPQFLGDSFMVLPKLPSTARTSFELAITFKANTGDGLLLFSQGRTCKHMDFFALMLRRNRVELRFSNGGDTAVLQTARNITAGRWHQVVVYRDRRDGFLMLDNGLLVRGSTTRSQKQMDLQTPLFVGGIPDTWVTNTTYKTGFNGCIKSLVVDGEKMDLRIPDGEMMKSHNIGECSNASQECPCQMKESCRFSSTGQPVCACPVGTAGKYCEREVSIQIPSLAGNSYITYPSLGTRASKAFTIRLVLKPKSDHGLIMLNADRTNGRGDFFSLCLREGNVEFMFDCGSGPALIRSKNTIMVDHWHTITIWRSGAEGSLTLDDGKPVYGKSQGRLRHIRLRQNLFLGGMKDYRQQPYEVGMNWGFSGCIQKVIVNHKELDLTSPLSGINVDNAEHVCVTRPLCLNGGTCRADMDSFHCECRVGFTGMFCEKELNIKMPSFVGTSYLAYHALGKESENAFSISLVLKAKSATGLILFGGQRDDRPGDFVSLALKNGMVEYVFDCGSGPVIIRSRVSITVDQWHTISISRNGNKGQLVLDDGLPVRGKSPGYFKRITFNSRLFLGGIKDYANLPLTIGVNTGFVGCIQKLTLNSKSIALSSPHSGVNVGNCNHACVTQYMCLNGGLCHASMESFRCQCAVGFTGKMCEEAVSVDGYEFDGQSFLTISRKKITKRISGFNTNIRMEIKTLSRRAVIVYVHQPEVENNSWFLVELINGFIQVRIKTKDHQEWSITSRICINDGSWHNVLIRRTLSTLFIQIDSGIPKKKIVDTFFLQFHPGQMFVGGFPSQNPLTETGSWPNFQGSIRELLIGGKSVGLETEVSSGIKARRYRTSS